MRHGAESLDLNLERTRVEDRLFQIVNADLDISIGVSEILAGTVDLRDVNVVQRFAKRLDVGGCGRSSAFL